LYAQFVDDVSTVNCNQHPALRIFTPMTENRKLTMEEIGRMSPNEFQTADKTPFYFLLDDVRSMNNVGSIFRTADAFRLAGIYLCGITPQPPHREIQKTALGATETVHWKHEPSAVEAVKALKEQGYVIVCAEHVEFSVTLEDARFTNEDRYVIVLGNEVNGVNQEIIDLAHFCIEIPQLGTKHSLNIAVAAGIIGWEIFRQLQ
jgi:tRNA G18 (ribose-2'-O)-methylase SpoU